MKVCLYGRAKPAMTSLVWRFEPKVDGLEVRS